MPWAIAYLIPPMATSAAQSSICYFGNTLRPASRHPEPKESTPYNLFH